MQTITGPEALREARAALRGTVALVPTMGALHAGHMRLIEVAAHRCDHVIASVFVNPLQFSPSEDLARYPRRAVEDAAMLARAGVALLWAPDAATMYPSGFSTSVSVGALGSGFEGAVRPGHFDGVATVVAKLFGQVRPDVAVFGVKDWQQLAVIRRMTADLDIGVEIVAVPTVRDADDLALSSRNVYLSSAERTTAGRLPALLFQAARDLAAGQPSAKVLDAVRAALEHEGFTVDYVERIDGDMAVDHDRGSRLIAAARLGQTRLLDNVPVE